MLPIRKVVGGLGNLMFKQAYIYARMREGIIPDVYVQGEQFWKSYEQEIKSMFGAGIGYTNMISLHIRRGDYLDTDFYVNLMEMDYYQRAIAYFPNERFLVFCYDRQDAKQDEFDQKWTTRFLNAFIPGRWEMWKSENEIDDLNKMASCKGNIMANSSFSWWAAYLNPNPNKTIICPKQWFTDGLQRCELLSDWIKI